MPGRGRGRLFVGTSGWSYDWKGFYPAALKRGDYLSFYSRHFAAVEVNYSFYHLPKLSTYEKWADQTPDGFVFALKLSRFVTHIKRLGGVKVPLRKFLRNASALGDRLGPILVQLPPSFKVDAKRLDRFLESAADVSKQLVFTGPVRLALEFRHPSWFESPDQDGVTDVLARHGAAFVFAHSNRYPYPLGEPVTAGFVYLRFHGPEKMFASGYGKAGLSSWAPKIDRWRANGKDVYVFFNNDVGGHAVRDARHVLALAR